MLQGYGTVQDMLPSTAVQISQFMLTILYIY